MPTLRLHATQALAAKLGGLTSPAPEHPEHPLIFDSWYANIIRRRKPQVLLLNPETLVTLIMPLAPARSLLRRVPAVLATMLDEGGAPAEFIAEHVDRLRDSAAVVKTADRRLVGIMNRHVMWLDHWDVRDEDEWWELANRLTETPVHAVQDGPGWADNRLAAAIRQWESAGVAAIPPALSYYD